MLIFIPEFEKTLVGNEISSLEIERGARARLCDKIISSRKLHITL
jgi:hypothetical protein